MKFQSIRFATMSVLCLVLATTVASSARQAKYESPWTDWSSKNLVGALIGLAKLRSQMIKIGLHDPHVTFTREGSLAVDCSSAEKIKYRTADGTCNDLKAPLAGAANVAFGRNVAPQFIDLNADKNLQTPSPALVSKVLLTRETKDGQEYKEVPFLNMLAAAWIQFMNHDWLSHGKNDENNPIVITDAASNVRYVETTRRTTIPYASFKRGYNKVFINTVTHWWDASQIYGSSQAEQYALRAFERGQMRTEVVNGRELLPKGDLNVALNKQNQGYEMTGFRDNWWVGLGLLHTLFVKEHNAIAKELFEKNVSYVPELKLYSWKNGRELSFLDEQQLDEKLFQTARLINAAVLAKIHTVEWTPAILPNRALKVAMCTNWYGLFHTETWFSCYRRQAPGATPPMLLGKINAGFITGGIIGDKSKNYGVPFSITEEFTSVYRLHSLLPENIRLTTQARPSQVSLVKFEDTRNEKAYDMMANNDLKDLFYSFGMQKPGQLVLNNFPAFMQNLKIPGAQDMDLAMVDIVRDRERAVPRYNQFRRGVGLKPIRSYADFFADGQIKDQRQKQIVDKLRQVYGVDSQGRDNVEMIDLLVGTLAEEVRPAQFGFGETLFQIFILMASRRLMADRFFTDDYTASVYTQTGLDWIDKQGTLAKIIVRHMPDLAPQVQGLETAFQPWKQ